MKEVDPFDLREPLPKSDAKKSLTFLEVSDIINNHMEEIESWPPSIWGFTRNDILDSFEDLKEKVRDKCC